MPPGTVPTVSSSAVQRYLDQVVATFTVAAPGPLGLGTSVVAFDDRTSSVAVAYVLPGRTLIACSAALAQHLRPLDGLPALGESEWRDRAGELGGQGVDGGANHVLPDSAVLPDGSVGPDWTVRWLDPTVEGDGAVLARFLDASTADDLDEADIDPDAPDPAICVLIDSDGSVGAYASGRPFWAAPTVDDIGVLVAPDHRGRGLGAAVVAAFCRGRRPVLPQLYRHADTNPASGGVARSLGFVEAHRVSAVTFDLDAQLGSDPS